MALLDYLSKFLPLQKTAQTAEYFFGLDIREGFVTGCVWGIEGNKIKIVATSHRKFHPEENFPETAHNLIEASNIALDEALADFEPEPEKILFGVPDSWLADEELKPKYGKVLKQLIKELDVVPLAYVSTTHAICHYLQRQEGVPTTAILVEIGDSLSVAIVKAGKVLGTKEITRGENLPRDIEKALLSFPDIEVLPAKILIFGKGEISHYKEELVSFNWMSQLPFLHLPKVEELEKDASIKSLSFAGASELNPNIHLEHQTVSITLASEKTFSRESQKPIHPKAPETAVFVEGDIGEDEYAATAVDVYQKSLQRESQPGFLGKFSSIVPKGVPSLSKLSSGFGFTIGIPIIILIVSVLAYLFLPKATVKVFVDPKILEKETQIVADPKITTSDEANKQIAGKIVETTVDGTGKAAATGKKQVGDAAKGTVIFYNATSKDVNISNNVILQAGDGKKFKLVDSSVKIASKSASAADPPSKSGAVNAVAVEIGPEGNISGGIDLKVGDFNKADVVAEVDAAFSGGVSKDVTVVTSDDQKKLLASLSSDLKKKAQEEIQGKLTGDMKILEETFMEKVIKQSFSKNAGDQTTEFSLTLNLNLKGTAYSDTDLKAIVGKLVETTVPEGYDLDMARTETQATVAKVEKDGKIIFTAKFKAKLMPRLDLEKIKSQIKFKTPDEVETILKSNENVIGADIKITPDLPAPLQRLPFLSQNINLEINSN